MLYLFNETEIPIRLSLFNVHPQLHLHLLTRFGWWEAWRASGPRDVCTCIFPLISFCLTRASDSRHLFPNHHEQYSLLNFMDGSFFTWFECVIPGSLYF